jgi:hypothetical protein
MQQEDTEKGTPFSPQLDYRCCDEELWLERSYSQVFQQRGAESVHYISKP